MEKELLEMLEKIVNRSSRSISKDSTGHEMVQLRKALIDQAKELVAKVKGDSK